MKVLSIEASTSSARAMIYDSEKGVLRTKSAAYGSKIDRGGIMNINGVCELVFALAREITADEKDIEAVGICGTWHNMCVFNRENHPVTDLYSWNYTGYGKIWDLVRKDKTLTDEFYTRTGCMPHTTYSRTAIKYLKDNGLVLEDKKFATFGGYCFRLLTGKLYESRCSLSGAGLINLESENYDDFVLDYLGIKHNQLGTLVSNDDVLPLSEKGAELLGLKSGIPVVPAHADGAMNMVAVKGNRPGVITMSVGTSGAMRMISQKPAVPVNHSLWCYVGVNSFVSGAATNGACNCINRFREENNVPYSLLEEGFNPRRDYPVFLPFIFGERCPGWNDERRDGFVQDVSSFSVSERFQAIEMGILFNLYQSLSSLEKANGKISEIILAGGITNSVHWVKMACDIFDSDIYVSRCPDASTIGAAALALHAAGALDDVNCFSGEYDKLEKVKKNPENHGFFMNHYQRYLEAYEQSSFAKNGTLQSAL